MHILDPTLEPTEEGEEEIELKLPKIEETEEMDLYTASETSSSTSVDSPEAVGIPLKLEDGVAQEGMLVELRCGELTGYLHRELFICPGIRVPCIETSDAPGKLLTPVEYTVKAGKDKQKDWKGSIKCNGKILRNLMESRQLDFFNHQYQCSAKCHSRNYMSAQKFDKPVIPKPPKLQKITKSYQKPGLPQKLKLEELMQNARLQACVLKMMEDQRKKAVQKNAEMIQNWIVQKPAEFCQSAVNERQMNRISSAVCQKIGQLSQELMANRPNFTENATRLCQAMQVLGMDQLMAEELAKSHVDKMNAMKFPVQVKRELPTACVVQKTDETTLPAQASPEPESPSSASSSSESVNLPNSEVPQNLSFFNNNNLSPSDILQHIVQQIQQ